MRPRIAFATRRTLGTARRAMCICAVDLNRAEHCRTQESAGGKCAPRRPEFKSQVNVAEILWLIRHHFVHRAWRSLSAR